jgi:hypothetical protein
VLDRPSRMIVLATVVAAVLGVAAGCGGDDDDDTAAETTTTEATTTAPVEDSLQQAADDAVRSCMDAVADLASPAGVEACEELGRSLDREIASLSASAREDVDEALKQLSAKCRNLVADIPEAAQEFGLTACDQLAAGG